ncbi:MAG: hypothetical protein HWE18_00755 [Gammaproteobacteria bacterium]|nr:hypothetical protein [Gammaproteobacteria bacterium]
MKLTERDIKVAIASAIVAMVVSVVMLDMKGYINHLDESDKNVIDTFKLLSLDVNSTTKVSPKASNKEAFCVDGYLLIRPQKNESGKAVAGVLVDAKNRGIPCSRDLPAPGQ